MNRSLKHKLVTLALTFVLAFSMTIPAAAEGLVAGDTIPAGTVYDHDAILIGQNVAIDGTVNGNVFVLGNQVTVNGKVDGSLILLGQNGAIGGIVTGNVYGGMLTLDLAPNAVIERDLYVASVTLTSGSASIIGRDLYAIGLEAGLSGQVQRTLHTVIGPIQLYNGLMTLLGYDNLTVKLHFEPPQRSTSPSGGLVNPGRHAYEQTYGGHLASLRKLQAGTGFDWGKWALKLLRNWAALFVFGLLAFWLSRRALNRSGEALQAHPWRALGTGLLVLALSIASIGAALLVVVIIFAIGLGFNSVGLWPLTIALWAVVYAALAVAVVALWAFIAYGTKIIAFYFVGRWALGKLFARQNIWMDLLALLAGSVVYALLRSIPYVGWIFDILVTALGAGAAWLALRGREKQRQPENKAVEPVQPVPAVETLPIVEPVPPLPVVAPIEIKSAKVVRIKKAAPVEAQPAGKISRRKARPAQPTS